MRLSKHDMMINVRTATPILEMDMEGTTDAFLAELALRATFAADDMPHRDPVLDWIN